MVSLDREGAVRGGGVSWCVSRQTDVKRRAQSGPRLHHYSLLTPNKSICVCVCVFVKVPYLVFLTNTPSLFHTHTLSVSFMDTHTHTHTISTKEVVLHVSVFVLSNLSFQY